MTTFDSGRFVCIHLFIHQSYLRMQIYSEGHNLLCFHKKYQKETTDVMWVKTGCLCLKIIFMMYEKYCWSKSIMFPLRFSFPKNHNQLFTFLFYFLLMLLFSFVIHLFSRFLYTWYLKFLSSLYSFAPDLWFWIFEWCTLYEIHITAYRVFHAMIHFLLCIYFATHWHISFLLPRSVNSLSSVKRTLEKQKQYTSLECWSAQGGRRWWN